MNNHGQKSLKDAKAKQSPACLRRIISRIMVLGIFLMAFLGADSSAWARVLSRDRAGAARTIAPPASDTNTIVVRFKDHVSRKIKDDTVAAIGGEMKRNSRFTSGLCTISIPAGMDAQQVIAQYKQRADVDYAEPNYLDVPFEAPAFVPNDPLYSRQWNFEMIHMPAAWDLLPSRGTSTVVVAIIDTGVAYENYSTYQQAPDLAGVNFVNPYDAVDSDGHPNDGDGHGTHVCGTIAQATHNGLGVAGMADHVSIMPIRSLGTGGGTHLQFSDAVHWAVDNGAKVINYSAGGSDSTTKHDAVIYAYTHGVLLIAAYGNDSMSNSPSAYPARYAEAMGVGAIDRNKTLAWYSNWGDGVDVVAPGGDTTASETNGITQNTFETTVTNFGYHGWQGTSMATPHVTGLAALLWSQGIYTARQDVADRITQTCENLGDAGYNSTYGWGRIDAENALSAIPSAPAGVAASDGTYTDKVRVTWNTTPNAFGYIVYRNTNSTTNAISALGITTNTLYDDSSVEDAVTYYYWVIATNAYAISPWSSPDTGYRAPLAPTGISASDRTYTNKVLITWNAASSASGYQIFRDVSSNSADAEQIGTATATTYDDTGAIAGTTYYYWAKSTNSAGTSGFSASDTGQRSSAVAVPSAPARISASDGTYTNKVLIAWNASADETTSYEVWRHTNNNSSAASKISNPDLAGTNYEDTSVTAGAIYYYWVKAVNAVGAGGFSDPNSGYAADNQPTTGNADLALSSLIFLTDRLNVGGHPGILSMALINNGPESLASPNTRIVIDVYLSPDATLDNGDDLWIGDYQMDVNLSAGYRTMISVSGANRDRLTIPSTAAGQYYVFARVRHAAPSTLIDPDLSNNFAMRADTINIDSSGTVYHPINDYDGDGKSDLALYEPATGFWYIWGFSMGSVTTQFGDARFLPCPGDFDNDGKSDFLVYTGLYGGHWMVFYSESQTSGTFQGGGLGYVPLRGDFDGDGQSDFCIYEEASGNWIMLLSTSGRIEVRSFGASGYDCVSGDFDGDGKTDPALYRAADSYWFWLPAGAQMPDFQCAQFGWPGSTPIPGDYDGDGTTDLAVYHPEHGWKIRYSSGSEIELVFPISGTPVVGDYDGDGKVDIAIYLPSSQWLILFSTTGQVIQGQFGYPGRFPVQ